MTTISAGSTTEIYLSAPSYTNPVVIDPGVAIFGTPDGVGADTRNWTVQNNGGIVGGTSGSGVFLFLGGAVTNVASAYIAGDFWGIYISGTAGTVVNDGGILGTVGAGVRLGASGRVTNLGYGSIVGGNAGVIMIGSPGTVVNAGAIAGTVAGTPGTVAHEGQGGAGVVLDDGGAVTNAPSAVIAGGFLGVYTGGNSTVLNAGEILNTSTFGDGVALVFGGSVFNMASGTIEGSLFGVRLFNGGTLTNAGTIIGTPGPAVSFGGTGENLLVLYPSYAFSGLVTGSASATNTLELASAASAGVLTGLGSEFTYFGSIAFNEGSDWSISGNTSGLAGTISGFALGDTIEINGITATGSSFNDGVLTLDDGEGSATLHLPGTFSSASDFAVTNAAIGADVTVACFAAGTRILTGCGEIEAERLTPGMGVPSLVHHAPRRVRWVGASRAVSAPVRIAAGAFAPGVPHRAVLLSPDHAVHIDGVLVPVRYLANGGSIAQLACATAGMAYLHVELDEHAVLLADGLPCESYLDTGNRVAFNEERNAQ